MLGKMFGLENTKYPGKSKEILVENQERKDLDMNDKQSPDGRTYKRGGAPEEWPIHAENEYNNPEKDEEILTPASSFVPVEDLPNLDAERPDEDESDLLFEQISEAKNVDNWDVYKFARLTTALYEDAKKIADQSAREKEINKIVQKTAIFFSQYKAILGEGLPEDEEYAKCQAAFKEAFGPIAYIGKKNKQGEMETKVERLGGYNKIQEPKEGASLGKDIYYNDRGAPFLSKTEAESSNRNRANRYNKAKKPGAREFNTSSNKKEQAA